MRIWKVITLLLILAMVGACAPADETSSTEETSTDSSAPATAETAAADKPKPAAPPKPPAPKTVTIPAGTTLSVVLSSSLDSGKNKAGDTFSGNLSEPIVVD